MAPAPGAEDDELVTVVNKFTKKSWKIRKSTLVSQSGFFEAFFDKDWEGVRIKTIQVDDGRLLDLLFGSLAKYGPLEFAGAIHSEISHLVCSGSRAAVDDAFEMTLDMYKIADKYDVPSLRCILADSKDGMFVQILEEMRDIDYFDGWHQEDWAGFIYGEISGRLGTYPKELYGVYCQGVEDYIYRDGNADDLIECISDDSRLVTHVLQYLIERESNNPRLLANVAKQIAAAPRASGRGRQR
jgi:hypothetical protein